MCLHPRDSGKKQIVVPSVAAAIIAITLDFYYQKTLRANFGSINEEAAFPV